MDISPKNFLKQRRPHKFSDSETIGKPAISRPILEPHLLNLTSRDEHTLFEKFARRLCEIEICPNLKPNTGPTGGGDGKTDAESYPVSSDTALGWYVGYETAGKEEKIAIAISAKKNWESKLKSDIKGIKETERKFTIVYFVTNQYVQSGKRKKLEKELSEQTGLDVHIIDLTWILDKVFSNNRIELAVKELNIEVDTQKIIESGPIDIVRQRKITKLDKMIEDVISLSKVDFVTVRNAIDSAVYSREQELPRVEVEGRLSRAIRLADKYGTINQKFLARYQQSWTAFWYFEDFRAVKNSYGDAQKHALSAGDIENLEKLNNLRVNLSTIRRQDKQLVSKVFLDNKTSKLMDALQKIASNTNTPSAASYAKALMEFVRLHDNVLSMQSVDKNLERLKRILIEAEKDYGFPFQSLTGILLMMEGVIGHSNQYDPLFKTIVQATQTREGEKKAAIIVLDRARILLKQKQHYKIIQMLGSALPDLHKQETLEEAAEALLMMGDAYKYIGLPWAARGSYLNAASLETARFSKEDKISANQLWIYSALVEIECMLGRIAQVLQWYEIVATFCNILPETEWDNEVVYRELLFKPDLRIGSLILALPIANSKLAKLIQPLNKLSLEHSAIATAYRINREDLWPAEFKDIIPKEDREGIFSKMGASNNRKLCSVKTGLL